MALAFVRISFVSRLTRGPACLFMLAVFYKDHRRLILTHQRHEFSKRYLRILLRHLCGAPIYEARRSFEYREAEPARGRVYRQNPQ